MTDPMVEAARDVFSPERQLAAMRAHHAEHVDVEVVADTGTWDAVDDGDTTSDEILGPVAGMEAEHNGWCAFCEEEIRIGDRIVLLTDGDDWIHEDCVEQPTVWP